MLLLPVFFLPTHSLSLASKTPGSCPKAHQCFSLKTVYFLFVLHLGDFKSLHPQVHGLFFGNVLCSLNFNEHYFFFYLTHCSFHTHMFNMLFGFCSTSHLLCIASVPAPLVSTPANSNLCVSQHQLQLVDFSPHYGHIFLLLCIPALFYPGLVNFTRAGCFHIPLKIHELCSGMQLGYLERI